ncbi:hypothetical protein RO575_05550 [Methylomonas sp. MO1]|uniref:hypothetical protein n=1 Tax=unclassified Methylomonas TaxID=2608980 RepID=UPI00047B1101|nr:MULTISPECIES: hypothetical protein [unclassified Methylomonas]MDT4289011.1 hypothetical protein [Methylomonas sp. MO1]
MERLFRVLEKINSILLLLVFVGVGILVGGVSLFNNDLQQNRGTIKVPSGESASRDKILLRLDRVQNIIGANAQMVSLTAERESGGFSSGGYNSSETRNILFLMGSDKTARWLFPKQSNVVLTTEQLREEFKDARDNPTRALYFEYVTLDTNADGKLSSKDLSSIGISNPQGLAFIEMLTGVSRVLSHQLLDSQRLSIVYQSGNVVRHAIISIVTMKIDKDQELIRLPDEL